MKLGLRLIALLVAGITLVVVVAVWIELRAEEFALKVVLGTSSSLRSCASGSCGRDHKGLVVPQRLPRARDARDAAVLGARDVVSRARAGAAMLTRVGSG